MRDLPEIFSEVASFLVKCRSTLPPLKQMRTVYEDNRRLVKRLRHWVLLKQFKQNAFWKYKCKSYFKPHIPETGVRFSYRRPVKPLTLNRSYGIIFILKDSNSNYYIILNSKELMIHLKLSCNYKADTANILNIRLSL